MSEREREREYIKLTIIQASDGKGYGSRKERKILSARCGLMWMEVWKALGQGDVVGIWGGLPRNDFPIASS